MNRPTLQGPRQVPCARAMWFDRGSDGTGEPASPRAPCFQGLGPGLDRRLPARLLRPRPARLPHLQRRPADPRPGRRPGRADAVHRRRHPRRAEGLPPQRADGVRLDLRPRRLPRPRLHGRLPAPRGALGRGASTAARAPTARASRRSPSSRRTATTPRPTRSTFTAAQARAFDELEAHYARLLRRPDHGARPAPRRDRRPRAGRTSSPRSSRWSAWAASARRPGHNYSYTNNWPPEELVDNGPTANVIVWSVLSLIALLGGIGLLFAAFGRWNFLGWHGREQATLSFRPPGDVALTPAQRACAWFFLVMAALFLLQTLVGRRLAALPRRARRLLRHRPGPAAARSTSPAPGTSSWRSSSSPPPSSPPGSSSRR